jgi:hypothetical protein
LTLSVLNSCSKTSKLDGTTWKGSHSYQRDDIDNSYIRNYSIKSDFTISFSESTVNVNAIYTYSYEDDYDGDGQFELVTEMDTLESISGTYIYSKKTVTVNVYGGLWIGTMDKNTMKLTIAHDELGYYVNEPVEFTKQ